MKIALLTIWHVQNYGAELQTYAMVKVLEKLGHHVEVINIRLGDCAHPNIYGRIGTFLSSFGLGYKKFKRFWENNIPTTKRYRTADELIYNPPEADIYLVGSDQVWNPDLTGDLAKIFFLDFGTANTKRISYASSFGKSVWTHKSIKNDVGRLLSRFSTVTCREESGVSLLSKEFGIISQCVIDPTLLLGDYSEFINNSENRETLVYYPLTVDKELEESAKRIANKLNLKLVNNKQCKYITPLVLWNQTSIEEWITNIATAKFVLTRSFHGMLFALMHKRQFAVVAGNNGRGTRLLNILEKVGLSDRYYADFRTMELDKPWKREIDYTLVELQIQEMRKESLIILKQMLDK